MRKNLVNILLTNVWITLFALTGFAGEGEEPPFLWRVEGSTPSYLFGTIHSSHPDVRDIPEEVIQALESSRAFHPELELSGANLLRIMEALLQPAGEDLNKALPSELWERARAAARRIGLPEFALRKMRPSFAPMLFLQPPDSNVAQIVDVQLYHLAGKAGLRIEGLESLEEQLKVFADLGEEETVEMLAAVLDEFEAGHPRHHELVRLYAARDLKAIKENLDREIEELPGDFAESILYRRNEVMVERLLPSLQEGGAFAAVGLGHIPGERGMIDLLEKKGFTVTRIETPVTGGTARE